MKKIRIGFDAKRLFHNRTGLGNYSRNLLLGLTTYYDAEMYLYSPEIESSPYHDFAEKPSIHARTIEGPMGNLKRTLGFQDMMDEDQIDLFHGLSNELPLSAKASKIPHVVTIHDLIYRQFPKDFSFFDRQIYQTKTKFACRHANQIVAISEATKKDIVDFLEVEEQEVKVIYQTCNPFFQMKNDSEQNVDDKNQDYLLYVGTLNHRKNLLGIVEAMGLIAEDQRPQLMVVGQGNQAYENLIHEVIEKYKLQNSVQLLGMVKNEELKKLYQNARITILPSFYEGFGIPIIESLFSDTPVITSDVTSLPEAAGPCAIYVDPDNVESIKEGIEKSMDDQVINELTSQIPKHIEPFRLENATQKWIQLYGELMQ